MVTFDMLPKIIRLFYLSYVSMDNHCCSWPICSWCSVLLRQHKKDQTSTCSMRRLPAAFELVNFGTKKGSRCWFPSSKTDWIIFNFASFSNKASPIFVRFSFIWGKKSFKVGTFPKNLPRLESFLPNVFQHQVGGEVFFSSNWPDRTYVSAYLPSLEAERLRNGLAVWGQETCFQNGKISGVQHMERNCVIEETFFFGGEDSSDSKTWTLTAWTFSASEGASWLVGLQPYLRWKNHVLQGQSCWRSVYRGDMKGWREIKMCWMLE